MNIIKELRALRPTGEDSVNIKQIIEVGACEIERLNDKVSELEAALAGRRVDGSIIPAEQCVQA